MHQQQAINIMRTQKRPRIRVITIIDDSTHHTRVINRIAEVYRKTVSEVRKIYYKVQCNIQATLRTLNMLEYEYKTV